MSNEGLRLTEEEIQIHYLGSRLSAVRDLLDAQIADLLSKVPVEKLKEEIRKIVEAHSSGYQQAMDEGCETDNYSGIANNDCRATDKLSELFQRFALSLQEQARKEEREKFVKQLRSYPRQYQPDFPESNRAMKVFIPLSDWQALQKEEQ